MVFQVHLRRFAALMHSFIGAFAHVRDDAHASWGRLTWGGARSLPECGRHRGAHAWAGSQAGPGGARARAEPRAGPGGVHPCPDRATSRIWEAAASCRIMHIRNVLCIRMHKVCNLPMQRFQNAEIPRYTAIHHALEVNEVLTSRPSTGVLR